jgi:hypothetical protein
LRRAIRCAKSTGLDVIGIDITKNGASLRTTSGKAPPELIVNAAKNAADVVTDRLG